MRAATPALFFLCVCGTRASHCCGPSHCGAQAPDVQAQWPWLTGPAAPRHVGSCQTGAQTRVACIGRRTLNHCATREARLHFLMRRLQRICGHLPHKFMLTFHSLSHNILYSWFVQTRNTHLVVMSLKSLNLEHSLFYILGLLVWKNIL